MNTLYIDVYFLINFTVDVLAIYFSLILSRVPVSRLRLVVGGLIGAISATVTVIFKLNALFYCILLILTFLLITLIVGGTVTNLKRFKIFASFLLFETLLGGILTYLYGLLDKYFAPFFEEENFGVENKRLLFFALLILMSIGFIKLMFYVFSGSSSEKSVEISFELLEKKFSLCGFVDSGNLLKDPMTLKPVVIVKAKILKDVIKESTLDLLYTEDERLRGLLRLIPLKGIGGNRILVGMNVDLMLKNKNDSYITKTVIAIDEEEGNFGGYNALIPSDLIS